MKKLIATALMLLPLVFLTALPLVAAQETPVYHRQYCLPDNVTLRWIKNVTLQVPQENVSHTIHVTEDQICRWGCANDSCLPSPWITWVIVFAVVIVIVFVYLIFRPR